MTAPPIVKITTIHQNRRRASVGRVPFTVGRDYRARQPDGRHTPESLRLESEMGYGFGAIGGFDHRSDRLALTEVLASAAWGHDE